MIIATAQSLSSNLSMEKNLDFKINNKISDTAEIHGTQKQKLLLNNIKIFVGPS